MPKTSDIQISDLLINTENYRFDALTGQKEAIDKMIENQQDKLYLLAEHIMEHGLNPNDRIQVVPDSHTGKKFIVLEGNRRTVALKLLDNPELIDMSQFSSLKKKFQKLRSSKAGNLLNEVECTVYDDPSEADVWIKIKHAGQSNGIGTVAWNAQQVQRFEEKVEGKSSIALQTINLLKGSKDTSGKLKENLSSLKITNLDRLLDDPEVRQFLGIEINNGVLQSSVEEKEVVKGLVQVAKDLLDPDFKVKQIYTKYDRRDYINNFPKEAVPNKSKVAKKRWQFTKSGSTSKSSKPTKQKPNPKDRRHLIPKSCILKIDNPKVNTIYNELQKLDLYKFTNAAAVLLRVFIELSLDCYMEKHNLQTANKDSKLVIKVQAVSSHMETSNYADKYICKGIRNAVQDKNGLLGIETWHAYVHNSDFSPTYQNLNITWDNLQTFTEKLWESVP